MSERVNQEKHELIHAYTHQLIYSICSTNVENSLQIDPYLNSSFVVGYYGEWKNNLCPSTVRCPIGSTKPIETAEFRIQETEARRKKLKTKPMSKWAK